MLILRGVEAFADESMLVDKDRQRAARFRQADDRRNVALGRTLAHHLVRPVGAPVPYAFSLGRHARTFAWTRTNPYSAIRPPCG